MSLRRAHFFGSLARLTGAGIPVVQAGEFLERHAREDEETRLILALRDGISRGETIAQALQPSLTAVGYGMVSAAEKGGRLDEGFAHLQSYYSALAAARQQMRKALIYPILLLHMAALASTVPAINAGANVMGQLAWTLSLLWLLLALAYYGARALCNAAAKSKFADSFLSSLPVAGKAWQWFALARWSAVMHFHILSAQRMSTALDAAGDACGSATLAAASAALSGAAAEGQSVAADMPRHRVFPSLFCTGFATAEISGRLDEETRQQMHRCLTEGTEAVNDLAVWLPRVIYTVAVLYAVWTIYQIVTNIIGTYSRAANGIF